MAIASFPDLPGVGYPSRRSPQFNIVRYEAIGGKRTIAPKFLYPRWRWQLTFNILRSRQYGSGIYQELEQLAGFFNARSADGLGWGYTDPDDYEVTDQSFGQGDGVTTAFQLYRSFGGFSEPIYAPAPTEVKVAGIATGAYTLGATGVLTFAVAPAAAASLTWTGTYEFVCRFDDDSFDIENFVKGGSSSALRFSSELAL